MQEEDTQHDDIIFDDENPDIDIKGSLSKLRAKLKENEAKANEYLTGWQKAKADLVNLRREDEKRMGERVKFAEEDLITELFPVLDSFSMAFQNKEVWESLPKEWRTGVEYIYSQLVKILENHGTNIINPLGEVFNPHTQEALELVPTDDETQDNHVLAVIQNGYTLHGKTVRTAKVRVGEFKK